MLFFFYFADINNYSIVRFDGSEVFEAVESVRKGLDPQGTLASLSSTQIGQLARAFTLFNQLNNTADDVSTLRELSDKGDVLKQALNEIKDKESFFSDFLCQLVLTAHPTEVQRQAVQFCHSEIASLMNRDKVLSKETEDEIQSLVATLWYYFFETLYKQCNLTDN